MKLYELARVYQEAINTVDTETWEITDEALELLDKTDKDIETKWKNIAIVNQELDNNIDALDIEIKRLTQMKKVMKNNQTRLKEYLAFNLEKLWLKEIKTDLFKIGFRKSQIVEVDENILLPDRYVVTKTTHTADKNLLKKALKDWEEIEWVKLVDKENLYIK
jgi:hypothetical protein